jgi:peptidoglycan/xylan/chitin deacetylase (PgdA/CDA1 family)
MKTKVIITVDTEPDNQWNLNLRRRPEFKNIIQLPKLQRLFDRFYARPTYLVTFSVAKNEAVSALKEIAKGKSCEIGSHLHAWEAPPFKPHIKGDGSYLHQYALDVQRQKIASLDDLISESFCRKPVSYRGGRWSFEKNIISILSEYGYLVDSSVSAGISWENDGGINFKKWPNKDCFFQSQAGRDILEVPPTIEIKAMAPLASKFLYRNAPHWTHAEGILRRLVNFNIIWLDPSFNKFEDMKWACDALLAQAVNCLNIMFHSCVIIPGGSPYTMTGQETKIFFERLEQLLDYLLNVRKLEVLTLEEFYNYHKYNLAGK